MNVYKHEAIDGVCIDKHDRHSNILWILDRSVYSVYYIKFKSALKATDIEHLNTYTSVDRWMLEDSVAVVVVVVVAVIVVFQFVT